MSGRKTKSYGIVANAGWMFPCAEECAETLACNHWGGVLIEGEAMTAFENNTMKTTDVSKTISGDHDNRVTDTGTSIVSGPVQLREGDTHTIDCANGQEVGIDFYNTNTTGNVSKTISSSATDKDHIGGCLTPGHPQTHRVYGTDVSPTLNSGENSGLDQHAHLMPYGVRILTPLECERLMGFPDGYTNIPWGPRKNKKRRASSCPDTPRYKACGNSWAVNCARWILRRIAAYDLINGHPDEHTYATVCSGVEAMSLAVRGMGWTPVFFSEIEPFPCALLAHHYPTVPNLGDMTKIEVHHDRRITNGTVSVFVPENGIDVFAGGTPCQDVSVAGKRAGMQEGSGTRSSLAFTFVHLVAEIRPRWVLWENVPGCLSSNGGRDFARFVRKIGELGYACGWRTLDAQYTRVDQFPFAVPQRRRRVWLVGHIGSDHRAVEEVLFESPCVLGDTPPRSETGKAIASPSQGGAGEAGREDGGGTCNVSDTIDASYYKGAGFRDGHERTVVAEKMCAAPSAPTTGEDSTVRTPTTTSSSGGSRGLPSDVGPTLRASHGTPFNADEDIFSQNAAALVASTLSTNRAGGYDKANSSHNAHLVVELRGCAMGKGEP